MKKDGNGSWPEDGWPRTVALEGAADGSQHADRVDEVVDAVVVRDHVEAVGLDLTHVLLRAKTGGSDRLSKGWCRRLTQTNRRFGSDSDAATPSARAMENGSRSTPTMVDCGKAEASKMATAPQPVPARANDS